MKKLIVVMILSLICLAVLASTHVPDTRYTADEFFYRDWRFAGAKGTACFGKTDGATGEATLTGYLDGQRFTSAFTGIAASVEIECPAGYNYTDRYVRLAIYADNGFGYPGARLDGTATDILWVSGQWVGRPTTIALVSGTTYWIAFTVKIGTPGVNSTPTYYSNDLSVLHGTQKNFVWGTAFPDPFGGFTWGVNGWRHNVRICYDEGGAGDVYSGRGIGRGISRGVMR